MKGKRMNTPMNNPSNNMMSVDLIGMTTDIVAAYVSNHETELKDLSGVIRQVYASLIDLNDNGNGSPYGGRPEPAVSIKKSIQDDYIVCLEDGKKMKMLKRHLKTSYNMTPEHYRERWNLPSDYPMVAPNYAKKRSELAMQIGLGRKRKEPAAA
jgi:predicted transcriptional regulator